MKKTIKYLLVVFLAGGFLNSCETIDLDLRDNPNILTSGDVDLLLTSIQLAYRNNMATYNGIGGGLTRIHYVGGRDYFTNYQGATMNGVWTNTYSNLFANLQEIERINEESDINYNFHVAVAKVMQAHNLMLLVDMIGDVAYTEALDPLQFPAPKLDEGSTVYAAALGILNEAEALLAASPTPAPATDFYYNGNAAQWIRAINSIRLKAHVTTNNVAAFNAVIAGNNFISTSADDLEFKYGSNELQPDTRHPDYGSDYSPSGANIYHSNWLMETMLEKDDPRIRYYYYRQVTGTPGANDIDGNPVPANEEDLACSLVVPPQHYIDGGFTYCSVDSGYWGRSHGNDEGTPPDGFLRTAAGVYPAAGRFDDNSFDVVGLGLGGGGAGIEPIILASYIDFWRADMAASDAARATFMQAGMEKSIAKVQTYAALDGPSDKSFEPDAAAVMAYVDGIVADFNAAAGDDKENIFAEQYWIALYGGAAESFNYYRKTGFPTTVTPNWELNPGPFPRSFLTPQNEVVTNPNLTQKTSLTEQVFWDTNPASPAFPPAN